MIPPQVRVTWLCLVSRLPPPWELGFAPIPTRGKSMNKTPKKKYLVKIGKNWYDPQVHAGRGTRPGKRSLFIDTHTISRRMQRVSFIDGFTVISHRQHLASIPISKADSNCRIPLILNGFTTLDYLIVCWNWEEEDEAVAMVLRRRQIAWEKEIFPPTVPLVGRS